MGEPPRSLNCFEGCGFFVFASIALGMGAMRVPSPAAGIITITFMAGCKYTSLPSQSSNPAALHSRQTLSTYILDIQCRNPSLGSFHALRYPSAAACLCQRRNDLLFYGRRGCVRGGSDLSPEFSGRTRALAGQPLLEVLRSARSQENSDCPR